MSKDSNILKSRKGEKLVEKYFESLQYRVEKVSNKKNYHWDLEATHQITNEKITIEVKTTAKKKFALVDLSDSQVIKNSSGTVTSLKADELWVVVDIDSIKPVLYKITKNEFERMVTEKPDKIEPKLMWKIDDETAEEYADKLDF